MTTGEIEDVISSIRRLVAEADGGATAPVPQNGSRLVLTPDYRIGGAAGAPNAAPDVDLEASVAELEAALAASAGKWRDEDAGQDRDGGPAAEAADERAGLDADGEEAAAAWDVQEDGTPDRPGAVIVELHADADLPADDPQPAVDDWEAADPPAPGFRRLYPEASGLATETGGFAPAGLRASGPGDDAAEDAAGPGPRNVGKPDAESLLDEDDLRQLVAEVLREELKGALGERITRNVRKLVRREIAQALSSMELD